MYKKAYLLHGIHDVRISKIQVLQSSIEALIYSGVKEQLSPSNEASIYNGSSIA